MKEMHEVILAVVSVMSLANLGVIGIYVFQHRLMWGDYKKRHKINGSDEKAVG